MNKDIIIGYKILLEEINVFIDIKSLYFNNGSYLVDDNLIFWTSFKIMFCYNNKYYKLYKKYIINDLLEFSRDLFLKDLKLFYIEKQNKELINKCDNNKQIRKVNKI